MASPDELTAWLDESSRETGQGLMVVVGAAVILRSDQTAARAALEGLRLPGQRYLHWRAESDERRMVLVEAVADLGFVAFVSACHPVEPRRQERARARNLKRLGHVLSRDEGIVSVVIEARSRVLDRRDAVAFREARAAGTVSATFRFDHAKKSDDPLLWAADIITSAQAYDLTSAEKPYWAPLQRIVLGILMSRPT